MTKAPQREMTEAPAPKRGRPRKQGRHAFNFRIRDDLWRRLSESAAEAGRSLTEEAEFRLARDLAEDIDQMRRDIERLRQDAAKWAEAARIQAIRAAGLQILREVEGRPTRVIVDLATMLAEADGLARGLRPGFFDDKAPPPAREIGRPATAEETERALRVIEEIKQRLEAAREKQRVADAKVA
jgi:hypothetical protein